jgi:tRNA (uracil-5-)-methyltransferase
MSKKKDFFSKYNYSILIPAQPKCIHFKECGGCSFQNYEYASQLNLKKEFLQNLFKKEIKLTPSPEQYAYRNKMDFVYAFGNLGLREKGNYKKVIEIRECQMMSSFAQEVYSKIYSSLQKYNVESYDYIEHKGFLRYISFRYSNKTKQIMLIFNSTTPDDVQNTKLENIFEEIKSLVTSIYWFQYDGLTDIPVPNIKPVKIIGTETIEETIGDKIYLISPWSFFQVNVDVAKEVFERIKENVSGNCIDLCCGVGAITIYVENKTTSIIGIEQVSQAIELANKNKILNKKTKPLFFVADMKDLLQFAPLEIDTLIIDPPRAGLQKKVCERILKSSPKKIIYMSCNPKTQKMDLDYLSKEYKLISIEGFDMFPQTPHLETLAILTRKED